MDLNKFARNVSSQWITHAVTATAGIVMPPLLEATLGREGYGVHNVVGDLGGYASFLYFGLGAAVLKYTAEHHARDELPALNETVSTIFSVYLRLGALCVLAAAAFAAPMPGVLHVSDNLAGEARARLVMLGVAIFAEFAGSVYGGVLMGMERFDVLSVVKLASLVVRNIAIALVVLLRPSVVGVGVVTLAVTVVEQVVTAMAAHRVLPGLRVSLALYRRERLQSLFSFSLQSFLFTMSERLINYTDNVVIAQARGAQASTPYAFPLRLVEFAREALERSTHVLMPGFSAAAARGELGRLRNFWRTGTKVLMALALPVALVQVLWGRHVLSLWLAGHDAADKQSLVAEGYPCLVWLALAFVMNIAGRGLARPLLEGLGELRVPARVVVLEALANLGLSIVLVRAWGIEGVAFATFLPATVTGLLVMPWHVCRRLELSFARHTVDTVLRPLVPLVPAWGVLVVAERLGLHQHLATLALTCAAVLVVYLVGAYAVVFDGDERAGLRERFRR